MYKCHNCKELMCQLRKVDFALYDLSLYLDSHPTCSHGLCYYNQLLEKRQNLADAYTQACGPLTQPTGVRGECWAWVKNPWPWELEG